MLCPSPEIVRAMIDEVKLGGSAEGLWMFVADTIRKSGPKTICWVAEALLHGVESGELKEVK